MTPIERAIKLVQFVQRQQRDRWEEAIEIAIIEDRQEAHRELRHAQDIINALKMEREAMITGEGLAGIVTVILAEDARVENGALENIPYLAVKIASSIEARTRPHAWTLIMDRLKKTGASREEIEYMEEIGERK